MKESIEEIRSDFFPPVIFTHGLHFATLFIWLSNIHIFLVCYLLQNRYDSLPPSMARFSASDPNVIIYVGYGMQKQVLFYNLAQKKVIRKTNSQQNYLSHAVFLIFLLVPAYMIYVYDLSFYYFRFLLLHMLPLYPFLFFTSISYFAWSLIFTLLPFSNSPPFSCMIRRKSYCLCLSFYNCFEK